MTHRDKIVVGKAFTNCRLYVLDENLKPVMPMARESCISAANVFPEAM